jgi:hypothetical protein
VLEYLLEVAVDEVDAFPGDRAGSGEEVVVDGAFGAAVEQRRGRNRVLPRTAAP